ncbi:phosphonate C-P lyase system protein PhnG [Frankia sp. AgB1.9]|uniref:phosphonate C-P lyase system protein PhnG n=1 Tax=unclassified Frankia TaxID=2632575 RepID=UPI0027DCFC31|nr:MULTISPECIES: phosphonate C-P lyase system protein PhnG [unclassified Frankia]MBL7494083.1 phosphonate C-P lyase system protein PhnG [Frankia sp. AgW1.1]MBL7548578.1 phosphonate C-P lyase system protein PhnG [Frankia sp. AgB1.9]
MTSQTLPTEGTALEARRRWMRTLATASPAALAAAWLDWAPKPAVQAVRGPEAGLVMVRARIDGGGARFNLGEATVTRATVRLHGEPLAADAVGTCYALGIDLEHARLAAIFDGLLTDAGQRERVLAEVIAPLEAAQVKQDETRQAEARSTLVDFFSVAREHG